MLRQARRSFKSQRFRALPSGISGLVAAILCLRLRLSLLGEAPSPKIRARDRREGQRRRWTLGGQRFGITRIAATAPIIESIAEHNLSIPLPPLPVWAACCHSGVTLINLGNLVRSSAAIFSVNLKSSFLTPPHSIDRANSPMVWLLKRFCWLTSYTQWRDSATWRRGVFCATV
jgi:hypothetical protein